MEHPGTVYIDRFGKLHSDAVFKSWSPRMIEIMRLKPVKAKKNGGQDD